MSAPCAFNAATACANTASVSDGTVPASGAMTPDYGCEEAQAERFQASASKPHEESPREGTMTILVYGHAEHMV